MFLKLVSYAQQDIYLIENTANIILMFVYVMFYIYNINIYSFFSIIFFIIYFIINAEIS